jgi:hypothetical protein
MKIRIAKRELKEQEEKSTEKEKAIEAKKQK